MPLSPPMREDAIGRGRLIRQLPEYQDAVAEVYGDLIVDRMFRPEREALAEQAMREEFDEKLADRFE